jgi:hypothetical protein
MNRFEVAENIRNKPPEQIMRFKAHRCKFAEGYKLAHFGIWKLSFKNRVVLSEKDVNFWSIISIYDFKPFETIDTIGDDSRPTETDFEETDHNFIPSLGMDYESPKGAGHKTIRRMLGFIA